MSLKPKGDEKPFNGMDCNGYSLICVAEESIASELPPVNLRLCAKRIWCNNTLSDLKRVCQSDKGSRRPRFFSRNVHEAGVS